MKSKLIIGITLISLSTLATAGSVFINTDSCSPFQHNDVTGCFLNKTGTNIYGVALREYILFKDGRSYLYTRPAYALYPEKYTGFSISKNPIEKGDVKFIEYSLVSADTKAIPLTGCRIKVTESYPKWAEIVIRNDNGAIHC